MASLQHFGQTQAAVFWMPSELLPLLRRVIDVYRSLKPVLNHIFCLFELPDIIWGIRFIDAYTIIYTIFHRPICSLPQMSFLKSSCYIRSIISKTVPSSLTGVARPLTGRRKTLQWPLLICKNGILYQPL